MENKAIKMFGIGLALLIMLTAFMPVPSAQDFEEDDGGVILGILLEYKQDLIAIGDAIQTYVDTYGDIQGFVLPPELEVSFNALVLEITDIMVQGFDHFYYDDYWTHSGATFLDRILSYNSSNSYWRRVGDDWQNNTIVNTIERTWARELVNGDIHELFFGISIFSPTQATRELLWNISFPDNYRGDPLREKKSRGGYFSGMARVDVTTTNGNEDTIYVTDPEDLANQLNQINGDVQHVQQIDIYDHGCPGAQNCGDDHVLDPFMDEWDEITDQIVNGGTVVLHGCNVASNDDPVLHNYLQHLADEGDVTVIGWTGKTWVVPLPFGNIWYIETGDEIIVHPINQPPPSVQKETPVEIGISIGDGLYYIDIMGEMFGY